MASNIHAESYRVKQVTSYDSPPIRLVLDVEVLDIEDDDPVEQIVLRKGVPATGSTKCGVESPEDNIALIYLSAVHYTSAQTQITVGAIVDYVSTRSNNSERISHFGWGTV